MARARLAASAAFLVVLLLGVAGPPAPREVALGSVAAVGWPPSSGLLVAEVVTGGASASDEYVELANAGPGPLDLAGLEVAYVTSSGATVTRKVSWTAARIVEPGQHVLLANAAGVFAASADATYSGGIAATGGALVLRPTGGTAIDAVGWGDAVNAFVEGTGGTRAAGRVVHRAPAGRGCREHGRHERQRLGLRRERRADAAGARLGPAAHPDADDRAHPDADAGTDSHSDSDPGADPDADADARPNRDAEPGADPDADGRSDSNPDADGGTHADAHGRPDGDSDPGADADADLRPDADTHVGADPESDARRDTDANTRGDPQPDADARRRHLDRGRAPARGRRHGGRRGCPHDRPRRARERSRRLRPGRDRGHRRLSRRRPADADPGRHRRPALGRPRHALRAADAPRGGRRCRRDRRWGAPGSRCGSAPATRPSRSRACG